MAVYVNNTQFTELVKKAGVSISETPAKQPHKKPVKRRYFPDKKHKLYALGLCLLAPTAAPSIIKCCTKVKED